MRYELWIDDQRNPENHDRCSRDTVVLWARDVGQAKFYVRRYGIPTRIYFDHDLGQYGNGSEMTVMEFLRWLENLGYDPTFDYLVISQNPDGAKSIVSFIESWRRVVFGKGA